jgi:hypothetical protein
LNERPPSGDIHRMTVICRSISLALLGIGALAGTGRAAETPLLVAVEVAPGVNVGPADVRHIVAAELGTPVIGSRESSARALAAWDEYLAAHPRGTFAPEARYNRALCLVRLGKLAAAVEALRPFAAGARAGYRRHEACLLLRWLAERGAPIDASCAVGN